MVPVSDILPISSPETPQVANNGYLVSNNILGRVHFGIVKYCEENRILVHTGTLYMWAVLNHSDQEAVVTPFVDFMKKWEAVQDLRSRREFARKKELESIANASGVVKDSLKKITSDLHQENEIPF